MKKGKSKKERTGPERAERPEEAVAPEELERTGETEAAQPLPEEAETASPESSSEAEADSAGTEPRSEASGSETPEPEKTAPEPEGAPGTPAARLRSLWSEELGGARLRAGRLWGRFRSKNYVRPKSGQVRQLIRRRFTYQELVGVFLALCPLVGVTASAADGLAAGLLSTLTVLGSVFIIEIFRRVLPDGIGPTGHMILVAGFTTALTLVLRAFLPLLVEELGIYLSMTVVSCLALERQVSPSRKQGSLFLLMDSVLTGLSFTLMLTAVSLLREFLGRGALFGMPVLGGRAPLAIMAGPFGGFFCLGCVAALAQGLQPRRKSERRRSA